MKTRIKREQLWRDRATLDELLGNALFGELHKVYQRMGVEPMLFPMDEVAILNEVGYGVTWLCWHCRSGLVPDMEQFVRDVYAHTGLKDHAYTVFSLVYAVVKMVDWPPLDIDKVTLRALHALHEESWCRRFVDTLLRRLRHQGVIYQERFLPCQPLVEMELEEEEVPCATFCAEAPPETEEPPAAAPEPMPRTFTLEQIVAYARDNLSLDASLTIQSMLYCLLSEDGSREERNMVATIPQHIIKRSSLTMLNPTFNTPLYEVKDNDTVNIGKQ